VIFADRIRSVGKQARDESGKYPVNEEDEEIVRICARSSLLRVRVPIHAIGLKRSAVIASAAKQSIVRHNGGMDCFAALAMTALTPAQNAKCPG
jgi:hypothetical protein